MRAGKSLQAERNWLLQTIHRIAAVTTRYGQTPGVSVCAPRPIREDDATVYAFGQLGSIPNASLELWLEAYIGDERELSFWIGVTEHSSIERIARAGDRVFPGHFVWRHDDADEGVPYSTPVLDLRWKGRSFYGAWLPFSPNYLRKAPSGLVTDIAFFFARLGSALVDPEHVGKLGSYWARTPGRLVRRPGRERIVSEYECPGCGRLLRSHEEECDRCNWSASKRLLQGEDDPLYSFEPSDT